MSSEMTLLNDGSQAQTPMTTGGDFEEQQSSSSTAKTQPMSDAERVTAIDALLAGEEPESDGEGAGEPEDLSGGEGYEDAEDAALAEDSEPETDVGPLSPTKLAEKLEIPVEDVYKMEIPTGDGEAVKLGELKDAWQNREAAQQETAKREAALDQRETAIVAETRLWGELGDQLNHVLTPQARQKLLDHMAEREVTERRRMVEAIPELGDQSHFDQFRNDVEDMLTKEYGFRPEEIVISDHRHIRVINDLMKLRKRLKALESFKPKPKPPTTKVRGRASAPDTKKQLIGRAKGGSEAQKVEAVSKLLGG